MEPSTLDLLDEVEAALIDILDGNHMWYDIKANTGLSEYRCKEISTLFKEVNKRYRKRHGIV